MSENLSINVLGVELNTSKMPKKGIKLKKLNPEARATLEAFDTEDKKGNKGSDGRLSSNEVRNIINMFTKYDTAVKDGKIDQTEANNMKDELNKLYESLGIDLRYGDDENVADSVKNLAQGLSEGMKQKKHNGFLYGLLDVIMSLDISL